jgi:hypothetical protein
MDPASAKTFFVDKVVFQAIREGIKLSDAEKYMLSWSESDPNFVQHDTLTRQFEREISGPEFKTTIAGLLRRAFDADVKSGITLKDSYREDYNELSKDDHYNLVMIKVAFESKLKKFWLW